MYNCLLMIFTAMSGIGACVAVIVAIVIYRRQKKIALFDRRVQILNDFEHFLFDIMPNWELNGKDDLVSRYTENEITALFDESYATLQATIIKGADEYDTLLNGIEGAKSNGSWNGKSESDLEDEKDKKLKRLQSQFKQKRNAAYDKWLKI